MSVYGTELASPDLGSAVSFFWKKQTYFAHPEHFRPAPPCGRARLPAMLAAMTCRIEALGQRYVGGRAWTPNRHAEADRPSLLSKRA